MLIVNVTHFDDITSSTGEVVTVYVVNVKYSFKSSYCLSKRYSDFYDLYNTMKDFLPGTYKFPNKSMFNSSAQFTKERRIKGFDEMLKILMKVDPFPVQLQRFLELNERVSVGSRENFVFLSYPTSSSHKNDLIRKDELEKGGNPKTTTHQASQRQPSLSINDADHVNWIQPQILVAEEELERNINLQVKRDFPVILSSSFRISIIVYVLFIVLSIVDISQTTLSQMLITLLVLGLFCTFIRIINFKIESRSKRLSPVDSDNS